jgi:uncharacterized membrane protein
VARRRAFDGARRAVDGYHVKVGFIIGLPLTMVVVSVVVVVLVVVMMMMMTMLPLATVRSLSGTVMPRW